MEPINHNYNSKGKKGNKGNKQSNPDIIIESYETQRFEVNDSEGYKYLGKSNSKLHFLVAHFVEDNGFVVFKGAANDEEIKTGISLSWDYLERLLNGVDRYGLARVWLFIYLVLCCLYFCL
jgi:hypothetical protein